MSIRIGKDVPQKENAVSRNSVSGKSCIFIRVYEFGAARYSPGLVLLIISSSSICLE
jgi:hypothetical protein